MTLSDEKSGRSERSFPAAVSRERADQEETCTA